MLAPALALSTNSAPALSFPATPNLATPQSARPQLESPLVLSLPTSPSHHADQDSWEHGFRDGYDARDAEVRELRALLAQRTSTVISGAREQALRFTPRAAVSPDDAMEILVAHGWRDVQLAVLLDGARHLRRCAVSPTIDRLDVSR